MRLAHCSDLHLLSLEGARLLDFANKRWIGGLNLLTSRGRHYHTRAFEDMVADFAPAGVDHVVCTGDITNLALEQEFRFARERFDRIGLGAHGVTVVPGNHDTYVAHGATHFAEIFPDYFARLREDYYKQQKDVVYKSIQRMLALLSTEDERASTEDVRLTAVEEAKAKRALEVLLGDHDGGEKRERHSRETLKETLVHLVKARY